MELKSARTYSKWWKRFLVTVLLFLVLPSGELFGQVVGFYTVKNGKMYIQLQKGMRESQLDSFLTQFNLEDLPLKQFIKNNKADSLIRLGWEIDENNEVGFVISKPLGSFENFNNPADKLALTEMQQPFSALFPAVNNGIRFGSNQFRNKFPFAVKDSLVTFFLRDNQAADRVMLSGSFNNWSPTALKMQKTDSGWIATVKLGPGKYWYKFIVDGNWRIDADNQARENDGLGNVNSVYFRPNRIFTVEGYRGAKRVYLAGSFNNWKPRDLQMNKTESGWELPLYLAEGTHTYRFIVDGKWMADASNPDRLPNEFGEYNSVVRIGKSKIFLLEGFENAKKVELIGSFNNWKENELLMIKSGNGWTLPYTLGPGNYEYRFKADGHWLTDPQNPNPSGNSVLIVEPNYTFRLKAFPDAKEVYLAGDFNNWNPKSYPMKRVGDEWVFQVHLFAGKVRYKYIVDGKWVLDPTNKLWEQNELGTGNSIFWNDK